MKVKPLIFAIDEEGIWYSVNPNYLEYGIELTKDDNGNPYPQTEKSLDYKLLFNRARNSWANNLEEALKHQQDFHKEIIESYIEKYQIKPLEFYQANELFWWVKGQYLDYEIRTPFQDNNYYGLQFHSQLIHKTDTLEEAMEFFQKFHKMIIESYIEKD